MKIYVANKMSLIVRREDLPREYSHLMAAGSCTEGITHRSVNFVDGNPIGGQGLTSTQVKQMVEMATKAGLKIEEPIIID